MHFSSENDNTNDVFISYAKEDEAIVRIIYQKLKISGISVWDYKIKSELGVDLQFEYQNQIRNSRYFLLIDSPFARKSVHVRYECEFVNLILSKSENNPPKVLICIAQKEGKWREELQLFTRQNYFTSILLYDSINEGIKKLSQALGKTFVFETITPLDKDFNEELSLINLNNKDSVVNHEEFKTLLDGYEIFQRALAVNDIETAENQINLIYLKCRSKRLPLPSIYLATAIFLKDQDKNAKAHSVLDEAIIDFPDDPRFFASLGVSYFYQGDYQKSIASYIQCLLLIKDSTNIKHKRQFELILLSLINVCQFIEYHPADIFKLLNQNVRVDNDFDLLFLMGQIYYRKGNITLSLSYYLNAFSTFQKNSSFFPRKDYLYDLIFCISQCYADLKMFKDEGIILKKGLKIYPGDSEITRRYAIHLLRIGNQVEGINLFQQLFQQKPDKIKYCVELAAIFHRFRHFGKVNQLLNECFELEKMNKIQTNEDKYYIGYAYYLNNKMEIAENYFRLAQTKPTTKGWVYYDKL